MKKVTIGTKPTAIPGHHTSEAWVSNRQSTATEPTKRLTIDVPLSLHQQVKSQCALKGEKFALLKRLVITAVTDQATILLALNAGADDFLMKPFTDECMESKLQLLGLDTGVSANP